MIKQSFITEAEKRFKERFDYSLIESVIRDINDEDTWMQMKKHIAKFLTQELQTAYNQGQKDERELSKAFEGACDHPTKDILICSFHCKRCKILWLSKKDIGSNKELKKFRANKPKKLDKDCKHVGAISHWVDGKYVKDCNDKCGGRM